MIRPDKPESSPALLATSTYYYGAEHPSMDHSEGTRSPGWGRKIFWQRTPCDRSNSKFAVSFEMKHCNSLFLGVTDFDYSLEHGRIRVLCPSRLNEYKYGMP